MAISAFGEVTELVAVYGAMAGLGTLTKSGNNITSIAPGETGYFSGNAVKVGTSTIDHDGTTMIGTALEAMYDVSQNVESYFEIDFQGGGYTYAGSGGASVVYVVQKRGTGNGQIMFTMDGGGGKTRDFSHARNGTNHDLRVDSAGIDNTIPIDLTAHVYVFTHNGVNSADLYVDGVSQGPFATTDSALNYQKMRLMGEAGNASLNGLTGLYAMYAKELSASEVADVTTLAQYWMDNGEAPSAGPGPSTTFGPITTNADATYPVTGYQWQESADGVAWQNVGTLLSDVTGQTTDTLTVTSAPIEADQTQVRCLVYNSEEPGGIPSHAATLTVQAPS